MCIRDRIRGLFYCFKNDSLPKELIEGLVLVLKQASQAMKPVVENKKENNFIDNLPMTSSNIIHVEEEKIEEIIKEQQQLNSLKGESSQEFLNRILKEKQISKKLIEEQNYKIQSFLSLYEFTKDKKDLIENVTILSNYENSQSLMQFINQERNAQGWNENEFNKIMLAFYKKEPVLFGAYEAYLQQQDEQQKEDFIETLNLFCRNSEAF
eukprot:TRINITY_DN4706_c0_g1_i4.p2 TRINITY_DN4706_c0_g1~~TRINITY_DN4706_c0_g1_i4.p2  ORF type:complete len:210 (-),score=51.63 TRINITY_DN4706_c0_g1_i4:56-685(-)